MVYSQNQEIKGVSEGEKEKTKYTGYGVPLRPPDTARCNCGKWPSKLSRSRWRSGGPSITQSGGVASGRTDWQTPVTVRSPCPLHHHPPPHSLSYVLMARFAYFTLLVASIATLCAAISVPIQEPLRDDGLAPDKKKWGWEDCGKQRVDSGCSLPVNHIHNFR